ncbi:hypothetical protein IEN85_15820 [Pelagicoccus sp. NFK12]|uniref:Uncharacterized protein n=1 Tax=Pelagicoccus enzymogenes TaxID=2773457 RepID=A0A927F9I0_9BACT|nr:hypothetical protein [Pelagicoccus enzymogenes]MBD5780968.1 hypothetical protein [Pelagicoccus enzymogenes]
MKSKNSDRDLWIPIEVLGLIGVSTVLSTIIYMKIASNWGPVIGGFIVWFGTLIAFLAYAVFSYKRIISKDTGSRAIKSVALAFLVVVINYLTPIFIYGPYHYGPGP